MGINNEYSTKLNFLLKLGGKFCRRRRILQPRSFLRTYLSPDPYQNNLNPQHRQTPNFARKY